jgi:hypothetical protein
MAESTRREHPFPIGRWIALAWFLVWFPMYWRVWGWQNFLRLCDVTLILSCLGFWLGDGLLISSQLLGAILPDCLWCLDVGWRLFTGCNLIGGTEYLWDANYPFWVRMLSLLHVMLPIILILACLRLGYDKRALTLESCVVAALVIVSRSLGTELNLNYAFIDPIFHRAVRPAFLHVIVAIGFICLVFLLPVHLVMRKVSRPVET